MRQGDATFPKAGKKQAFEMLVTARESLNKFYSGNVPNAPKRIVLIYDRHLQASVAGTRGFEKTGQIHPPSSGSYLSRNGLTGVVKLSIGAPLSAIVVEDLIVMGVREFLILGTAGGMMKPRAGEIVLCTRALRDEGTSHNYLPNSRYVTPDEVLTKALERDMKSKIRFRTAPTWTIDAPYTETRQELVRYVKEGVMTVEMEAAAPFAVTKVRGARAAAVFLVSDILTEEGWTGFVKGNAPEDFNDLVRVLLIFSELGLASPRRKAKSSLEAASRK